MVDKLLTIIAPHHCYGCGFVGASLCQSCINDIVNEPFVRCIVCTSPVYKNGICTQCKPPYAQAWVASDYEGTMETAIKGYKLASTRELHREFAQILHQTLPYLPPETIIVPVPTVSAHVRQRGFDHVWNIAKLLARSKQLPVCRLLVRQTRAKQRGSGRQARIQQARHAFRVQKEIDKNAIYLIVDDVVTTGATIHYAATALRQAGAQTVWVAALARKTLD